MNHRPKGLPGGGRYETKTGVGGDADLDAGYRVSESLLKKAAGRGSRRIEFEDDAGSMIVGYAREDDNPDMIGPIPAGAHLRWLELDDDRPGMIGIRRHRDAGAGRAWMPVVLDTAPDGDVNYWGDAWGFADD